MSDSTTHVTHSPSLVPKRPTLASIPTPQRGPHSKAPASLSTRKSASSTPLAAERTALAAAAAALAAAHASALEANTDELAEIALAVVRVIITDAFSEAPERSAALARAALEPDAAAVLRVGPALHVALLESGESSSAILDTSLAPYGCVAESPSRRVLAGLEVRLDEVLRALKEAT